MHAVIVSHGSPSDPDPQEAFVTDLAARVSKWTGHDVRGATLAKPGALEAAVDGLIAPVIFPHFMADGWFVSTNLQNRLEGAGLSHWHTSTPLGMTNTLPGLAARHLRATLDAFGMKRGEATLIIAAHGSPSDPRPAQATYEFARILEESELFAVIRVGFVDEEPSLEEAARVFGPAIVLPFFAARAGHVLLDLPEALDAADFDGPVLDPIGTWKEIPLLISKSLQTYAEAPAA